MIYSTNFGVVGKQYRPDQLGFGWDNIDVSWEEAFTLITVDGFPVAPELVGSHRQVNDFVSHQLVLVDIDYGMTIAELFEHPFYEVFGAGFYTTPSHTDENPRFRIMHRLESPITNSEKMRTLYRALMGEYGSADTSCKDAARLFFGSKDCQLKEKRDNILTDSVVEYLISELEEKDNAIAAQYSAIEHTPLDDEKRQHILSLLAKSFVGQYQEWRNIGWALRTEGFSLADFQYVTTGMMNSKSPKDASHIWGEYKSGSKVHNMGTIINFLKIRYGGDFMGEVSKKTTSGKLEYRIKCLKQKRDALQSQLENVK